MVIRILAITRGLSSVGIKGPVFTKKTANFGQKWLKGPIFEDVWRSLEIFEEKNKFLCVLFAVDTIKTICNDINYIVCL